MYYRGTLNAIGLILAVMVVRSSQHPITTRIAPQTKKCFYDDLPQGTTEHFHFSVIGAPTESRVIGTINVIDRFGAVSKVSEKKLEQTAKLVFKTKIEGVYEICLELKTKNNVPNDKKYKMQIDIEYGENPINPFAIAETSSVDRLNTFAQKALNHIKQTRKEQIYLKIKEAKSRATSDSISRSLIVIAILHVITLVSCVALQTKAMKQFFRAKKLI